MAKDKNKRLPQAPERNLAPASSTGVQVNADLVPEFYAQRMVEEGGKLAESLVPAVKELGVLPVFQREDESLMSVAGRVLALRARAGDKRVVPVTRMNGDPLLGGYARAGASVPFGFGIRLDPRHARSPVLAHELGHELHMDELPGNFIKGVAKDMGGIMGYMFSHKGHDGAQREQVAEDFANAYLGQSSPVYESLRSNKKSIRSVTDKIMAQRRATFGQ